ncbi:RipA family octameric membrane protein [Teredinibacter purpureus]|uniref:RipA family octameric membrane protein n=1 Tax=Teredinibacter purpureus TaxID=2731756 RepID=UPI000697B07D|nr:hypothetical protein [Teredinibacter purpureus]
MGSEEINRSLYASGNASSYEENTAYQAHMLEQYKLYQSSAEKISDRRQTANSFFVTINTALVSLISYLNFGGETPSEYYWLVSLAGIAISYMWYRLVRSYKDLNSAKFKVIHEIEKSLPVSPYDAEWEAVGRGEKPELYLPFTHIEIFVPWVFIALHSLVLINSAFPYVKG